MGFHKFLEAWVGVAAILCLVNECFAVDNKIPKGLKEGDKCSSDTNCDPIYIKGLKCVNKKCQCAENVLWDSVDDQCVWKTYNDECKPNKGGKDPAGNCEYGLKCVGGKCKCMHVNSDLCDGRVLEGLVHARSAAHQRESAEKSGEGSGASKSNFKLGVLIGSISFGIFGVALFGV